MRHIEAVSLKWETKGEDDRMLQSLPQLHPPLSAIPTKELVRGFLWHTGRPYRTVSFSMWYTANVQLVITIDLPWRRDK